MARRIAALTRLANSGGNPAWSVEFTDGHVARTAPGSQIAHAIENSEYQDVDLDVAFDDTGRITGVVVT